MPERDVKQKKKREVVKGEKGKEQESKGKEQESKGNGREKWSQRVKKKRVGEKSREEEKGGKGKTNILSPPGTQLAARGCCLYIRTVDKAAARTKNDRPTHCSQHAGRGGNHQNTWPHRETYTGTQ